MIYTRTYKVNGKVRLIRLYRVFTNMHQRCCNANVHNFNCYGGRGIAVCNEWDLFGPFRNWAIENGYCRGLSIDRIDNDGDYSPSNCRWATAEIQENNKKRGRIQRRGRAGNGRKRPTGIRHANAKLAADEVREIRASLMSHAGLAKNYNIAQQVIWRIKNGTRYGDVR